MSPERAGGSALRALHSALATDEAMRGVNGLQRLLYFIEESGTTSGESDEMVLRRAGFLRDEDCGDAPLFAEMIATVLARSEGRTVRGER